MGFADSPIKLEITNDGNEYDLVTNTVSINRNWADGIKQNYLGNGTRVKSFLAMERGY